jgi:hypothetical protein
MPTLDVSDVLDDPDFADDSLICLRNSQTMGSDGRVVSTPPVLIPFSGVVTAMGGQELLRKPDGEYNRATISVITRFTLYTGKPALSADVIQWGGNTYTVVQIDDYSRYGSGFVQATAELRELSG